jgi:hypothetical protein
MSGVRDSFIAADNSLSFQTIKQNQERNAPMKVRPLIVEEEKNRPACYHPTLAPAPAPAAGITSAPPDAFSPGTALVLELLLVSPNWSPDDAHEFRKIVIASTNMIRTAKHFIVRRF